MQAYTWPKAPIGVLSRCAVFLLIASVLIVYWPSLHHGPRADQWGFLLDQMGQHSCVDQITNSYSYNRTSAIGPSDTLLFRPGLFLFLSTEECVSGTHILIPQLIDVALHLLIALLAFSFLCVVLNPLESILGARRARDGLRVTALLGALYFALCPAVVEQVVFAHVGGYLVSTVLILLIARSTLRGVTFGGASGRHLLTLWSLCLAACFFYEANLFAPILVAAFIWIGLLNYTGRSQYAASRLLLGSSFLVPPLVYAAAYVSDQAVHHTRVAATSGMLIAHFFRWETVENAFRFLKFTVALPIWVLHAHPQVTARIGIPEITNRPGAVSVLSGLLVVVLCAGLASSLILAGRRPSAPRSRRFLAAAVFLSCWLAAYVAINVIGRMNVRTSPQVLSNNSYYIYVPFLIAVLLLVVVGEFWVEGSARLRRQIVFLGPALAGALVLFIAARGRFVFATNRQMEQHMAPFVHTVDSLNRQLARDPFASFRISPHTARQFAAYHGIPDIYILFASHIQQCGGNYQILAHAPYVRPTARGTSTSRCYPEFVRPTPSYNYFYFRDAYWGLPYWSGFPDLSRGKPYPYQIRAASLRDAMGKEPAMLAEQAADARRGKFVPGPILDVQLVVQGDHGFNILKTSRGYLAIPQGEGAFDWARFTNGEYSAAFGGETLGEVEQAVESYASKQKRP